MLLISWLMGLQGHWHWNSVGPRRWWLGVDLSVNARRAFCLCPALYIKLTVPHHTLPEAEPSNHDSEYTQYYNDGENSDDWANGGVSRVTSVVSPLRYKPRWRLLIQCHWHYIPKTEKSIKWFKEDCKIRLILKKQRVC